MENLGQVNLRRLKSAQIHLTQPILTYLYFEFLGGYQLKKNTLYLELYIAIFTNGNRNTVPRKSYTIPKKAKSEHVYPKYWKLQLFLTNSKQGLYVSMCVSGGMPESNQLTQEQETRVNFERLVNAEKNWKYFESKYYLSKLEILLFESWKYLESKYYLLKILLHQCSNVSSRHTEWHQLKFETCFKES